MVSWVMLTLSSREHIPPLSSFTHPSHVRSKYSSSSFRQKNEPENVRAHKLSYKGRPVPFPPDQPTVLPLKPLSNLSQIYTIMGRKAPTAKELLEKAAARGYQPGAHREKDVIKEYPNMSRKLSKIKIGCGAVM